MVAVVGGSTGQYCTVNQTGRAFCGDLTYVTEISGTTFPPFSNPLSTTLSFSTIRIGTTHACGISTVGQTYCWGSNDYGQFGNGTTVSNSVPTLAANGMLFESLAAGGTGKINEELRAVLAADYTCGVVVGGKAYCWGANLFGQIGNGSTTEFFTTPQEVSGGLTFSGLRGGVSHVCALATTGAAYCWGGNEGGQFGDQTTTSSRVPTLVFGK
jgi:alpha-tubulin suppressor-like RCC1 family protein